VILLEDEVEELSDLGFFFTIFGKKIEIFKQNEILASKESFISS
jgi:hypothetical protein